MKCSGITSCIYSRRVLGCIDASNTESRPAFQHFTIKCIGFAPLQIPEFRHRFITISDFCHNVIFFVFEFQVRRTSILHRSYIGYSHRLDSDFLASRSFKQKLWQKKPVLDELLGALTLPEDPKRKQAAGSYAHFVHHLIRSREDKACWN